MTGARKYRPGAKNPRHRKNPNSISGKMSPGRYAWLRTHLGQMQIMRYGESPHEEVGQTIVFFMPRPNARPVQMNFTALTEEELKQTRQFFNHLFDLAEPICRERDRAAYDAFESGDDSFLRLYRQPPQLIVREGAVAPYVEGVLGGSEDVPDGDGEDGGQSGGVRAAGDAVASEESADSEAEDDESQAD